MVEALRDPIHGCPWDLEQTHISLTKHMIEEAHECVEAIESGQRDLFVEELGDVLLQVILHSVIAEQNKYFKLEDVIKTLNEKLVYRHSHVFGDVQASNAKDALANWEKMKAEAKAKKPAADHFEVPLSLPALQRSQKIGEKTKKFNFDWQNLDDVRTKVLEELEEFDDACNSKKESDIEDEMGDLLFSVTQLARHAGVEAEAALRKANAKFEKRFFNMKSEAESQGVKLQELSPEKLEELWQKTKARLNQR